MKTLLRDHLKLLIIPFTDVKSGGASTQDKQDESIIDGIGTNIEAKLKKKAGAEDPQKATVDSFSLDSII